MLVRRNMHMSIQLTSWPNPPKFSLIDALKREFKVLNKSLLNTITDIGGSLAQKVSCEVLVMDSQSTHLSYQAKKGK